MQQTKINIQLNKNISSISNIKVLVIILGQGEYRLYTITYKFRIFNLNNN